MSERSERLRAAEEVAEAASRFIADWDVASILDYGTDTPHERALWGRKLKSEKELNAAVGRWRDAKATST